MRHKWIPLALVLCITCPLSAAQMKDGPRPPVGPEGVLPVGADGKPLNLDFETGTLKDWTLEGDAFVGQPVKGDVVAKRLSGVKSQHQGQYWIGGYERRGDQAQGTLTSVPFKVTYPWGSFLIGGGAWPSTCVELVRKDTGQVFFRAHGDKKESLRRVAMDLKGHMDREIFIRLVDRQTGDWGHINFDDFRFHSDKPDAQVLPTFGPPPPRVVLETGGHTSKVVKLFFTRDSQELVTASQDGTIRYWDTRSGELKRVVRGSFWIGSHNVAVSPDRKTLAVYLPRGTIQFINVADGKIRNLKIQPPPQDVSSLAFSPDGTQLAIGAGQQDREAFVVDIQAGKRLHPIRYLGAHRLVAWSPDGNRLASHAAAEGIGLLNVKTGKTDLLRTGGTQFLTWTPDSKYLVHGATHGIELWDVDNKKVVKKFEAGSTTSVYYLPDSKEMLTTGTRIKDNRARFNLLDTNTGKERQAFDIPAPWVPHPQDCDISPDGKLVATANGPENIAYIWQRQGAKLLHTLRGKGSPPVAAGWSPDGKTIAWGHSNQKPDKEGKRLLSRAFDLSELQLVPKFDAKVFRRSVHNLAGATLSPNQGRVVRDGKNNDLQVSGIRNPIGTLLPDGRAIMASEREMYYYDINLPGIYDKGLNRYYHPAGRALDFQGFQDDIEDLAPSPDNQFLLTASRDQVLRVWKITPKKLFLLLSVFVAGQDWIVWTPQGYYAASPGGERLMGWQVDNGAAKLATFYPAERFRKERYRPDIIKLVLQLGHVQEAIKTANAARGKETRNVKIEDLLPPRATLTVVDQSRLPTVKLKVHADASARDQPITALRLLVDGRPAQGKETLVEYGTGQQKVTDVFWTFELPEGEHQLSVLARSPDSSSVSPPVRLKHTETKKLPVLHVLTVGINNYKDGSLDLKYAAPDAEALAAAFAKYCAGQPFHEVKTRTLLNQQATAQNITTELLELRKTVAQQDLVVVFFACHGVKYKKEYYLLTHEADIDHLDKTCLSGDVLRKTLAEFKCQVLLMLDACHSAGFGEGKKLSKLGLKPATDDVARDLTEDDYGVAVMCAAMGHEKAEGVGGHGLFTKAVLEALEKKPGVPVPFNRHNQRVYIHHLQSFVFDEVSARSEERQHPFLSLPWVVESFPVR